MANAFTVFSLVSFPFQCFFINVLPENSPLVKVLSLGLFERFIMLGID